MSGLRTIGIVGLVFLALAGCNRRPDPMTFVQSPEEYACREAVKDVANSRKVTLLALAKTENGAQAQILADRDGSTWTCQANSSGVVTGLIQGLGTAS